MGSRHVLAGQKIWLHQLIKQGRMVEAIAWSQSKGIVPSKPEMAEQLRAAIAAVQGGTAVPSLTKPAASHVTVQPSAPNTGGEGVSEPAWLENSHRTGLGGEILQSSTAAAGRVGVVDTGGTAPAVVPAVAIEAKVRGDEVGQSGGAGAGRAASPAEAGREGLELGQVQVERSLPSGGGWEGEGVFVKAGVGDSSGLEKKVGGVVDCNLMEKKVGKDSSGLESVGSGTREAVGVVKSVVKGSGVVLSEAVVVKSKVKWLEEGVADVCGACLNRRQMLVKLRGREADGGQKVAPVWKSGYNLWVGETLRVRVAERLGDDVIYEVVERMEVPAGGGVGPEVVAPVGFAGQVMPRAVPVAEEEERVEPIGDVVYEVRGEEKPAGAGGQPVSGPRSVEELVEAERAKAYEEAMRAMGG